MFEKQYSITFRCFYENGNKTEHRQTMKMAEIPLWIAAYKYTHPACESVSAKIWFDSIYPVEE